MAKRITAVKFLDILWTDIKSNLKNADHDLMDTSNREILFLIACEKFPTFWAGFDRYQKARFTNPNSPFLVTDKNLQDFKTRNNFIDIQKYCAFLDQMDILEIESLFDYIGEGGRVENIIQYQMDILEIEKTATTPATFFNAQLDIFGNETKINKAVKQLSMF